MHLNTIRRLQFIRRFSSCPFRVLGLTQTASADEVKQRFRDLAKQFHPDVNKAPDASTRMAEISAAYEKLTDGSYKGEAESDSRESSSSSSFSAFAEAFERMRRQTRPGASSASGRGADISATMEISFSDLFRQESKTLRVPRVRQTCETCTGSGCRPGTTPSRCGKCKGTGMVRLDRGIMSIGIPCDLCAGKGERITTPCGDCQGHGVREKERVVQVKIPTGVRNFMEIRIPSMGHAGTGQLARNGDLYVTVKIQEDPVFKVLDDDVYVDLHLSLAHFFLGISDLEVPLPEGGTVRVVVAANTPIGTTKVLKGRGLAKVGKSRGDLVAKLNLKEYKALSPRQIQLIKEFDR